MINKNLNIKINSKAIFGLLCFAVFFLITNCDPDETQDVTNFKLLVMEDEFDGTALNPDVWTPVDAPALLGNGSLQYYTSRPENILVEDGMLKIIAREEAFEGSAYTSGRIETNGLFEKKYGRFEARIKMPWGQGIWPAFWMLGSECEENDEFGAIGWPNCGEIDIVEVRGQEPTIVNGTIHGPGYAGGDFNAGDEVGKSYDLVDERVDTDFHIYGIEWGEGYINFYVDDVLYNQIKSDDEKVTGEWVFDNPFYMILNLAVGGGFSGPPNADTVFPQTMYIDYVRVYTEE
jgi:beta-glucanase (GH16 family)